MARLIRIAPWAQQASPSEFLGIGALPGQPFAEVDEPVAVEIKMANHDEGLNSRKIEAQARADERRRLSRLLHDEVGQSLTALTVKLAILRGQTSGAIQTHLLEAQQLLEQTLDQVQGLSKDLHPSAVEDLGLVPALRSYIQNFSQNTAMSIRFKALNSQLSILNSEFAVAIFRSVEALLADLRDAAPSKTILTLAIARNALQLEAKALLARRGANTDVLPDVRNFHEQVLMAGGSVECRASRNHALITARFPVPAKSDKGGPMTNHGKV
jgi:signal transduction histidine kinase